MKEDAKYKYILRNLYECGKYIIDYSNVNTPIRIKHKIRFIEKILINTLLIKCFHIEWNKKRSRLKVIIKILQIKDQSTLYLDLEDYYYYPYDYYKSVMVGERRGCCLSRPLKSLPKARSLLPVSLSLKTAFSSFPRSRVSLSICLILSPISLLLYIYCSLHKVTWMMGLYFCLMTPAQVWSEVHLNHIKEELGLSLRLQRSSWVLPYLWSILEYFFLYLHLFIF